MFLIERYRHPRTRAMGDISICGTGPADAQAAGQALLACARQLGAKVSCESVTGIISLTPSQASPARLLTCNRDHWAIENGLLAAMNNLVISVLNRAGHTNNASARRELGWDCTGGLRALELLGL